jgi:hypothetical protein
MGTKGVPPFQLIFIKLSIKEELSHDKPQTPEGNLISLPKIHQADGRSFKKSLHHAYGV